jgi:hypothetical protein
MARMLGRDKVIKAATAVHLAIAAIYGVHFPVELYMPRAIDRPLSIYGGFTGTRARFDFFAPSVPTEARAHFLIVPADGGDGRWVRLSTPSGEANRRLALMFTVYAAPTERERLLQAWGEYMLRLHPEAVEVRTRVEVMNMLTMSESAAGKQPSWTEAGRATVRRGDVPGS